MIYISALLILALLAMIVYDIYLFFKMKVYKTYSTSSILLSCITLLAFRVYYAFDFVLDIHGTDEDTTYEAGLIADIPWFAMNFITLCLIYQWKEIALWLIDPCQALRNAECGKNIK